MAIGNILVRVSANISDYEKKMKEVGNLTEMSMREATYAIQRTGKNISKAGAVIAASSTAIIGGVTGVAAKYEQEFTNVKKVLDGTPEQFEDLSLAIRNMSKEIPMSRSEIARLAESAGRLGVPIEDIERFTRTTADLGVTTNMAAEDAAEAFARFANVMDMPLDNVDRLGSTVVALGNNLATSEKEIVEMGMRMAGVGRVIGMTEAEVMSFAGAISATGIRAEAGGSAFTRVSNIINKAVGEGGDKLQGFAKVAGVSADEFASTWGDSPADAIVDFVSGLQRISDEGGNTAAIMEDLGISGVYNHDLLNRLAGSSEQLAESVKLGNKAWKENTALQDEANQRYDTFISKLTILGNRLSDIALVIGNEFMKVFSDLIDDAEPLLDFLENLAKKFEESSDEFKKFVAIAALLAPVGGIFLFITGTVISLVGKAIEAARVFHTLFDLFRAGSGLISVLGASFTSVTLPILAVIGVIAAIGAILVWAYNEFEWFRDVVHEVWDYIYETISTIISAVLEYVQDVMSRLVEFWRENGESIKEAVENIWGGILSFIEFIMPAIEAVFKVVWKAVEFLVKSVWENIKGVIDGALNIIMGLIKTFSGLFTGDWEKLWEGIKQLFIGVIEFIWNLMQLMFWGRLIKGLGTFAKSFGSLFTNMWATIKTLFSNSINFVKEVFTKGFNSIKNFATSSMGSVRNVISTVWNTIKNIFSTVLNTIINLIKKIFGDVPKIIRNRMADAVGAISKAFSQMVSKGREKLSDFLQIGKDIVKGIINGIKNMSSMAVEAITGVVDGVINKAKSLLGIKSPSRVFMSVGRDTVRGYESGIQRRKDKATEEVTNLFDGILDKVKEFTEKERYEYNKNAKEISKIEERAAEDIRLIRNKAANAKRKLTEAEAVRIRRIEEDSAKKIRDLRQKNNKLELDILNKHSDELIKASESYVKEKKKIGEMSLSDEIYFWNAMYRGHDRGSKEYEAAMKNHQEAVKNLRSEVESVMKDYNDRAIAIEEEYVAESKKLYDEINKAYDDRLNQLKSFVGVFDEFERETEKTGDDLIKNLENQVDALYDYSVTMESLERRIDNKYLLDELREMGVKSVGELEALNKLSDKELQKYVKMYEQKFNLAKQQTDRELAPMTDEVDKKLIELRKKSEEQLKKLAAEWRYEVNEVVNGTQKEFDSMRQVGIDAVQGLNDGLKSMSGELQKSTNQLADIVVNGLKNSFDIQSPSRVTRSMGMFIGEGMADGIDKSAKLVASATENLSEAAMPEVSKVSLSYATPNGVRSDLRSAVNGTVDIRAKDESLINAINELKEDLTDLTVQMDGQEVARLTNNYHDRMNVRNTTYSNRARGVTL